MVKKRKEGMVLQVKTPTVSAINMLVAEEQLRTGQRPPQDKIIWDLLRSARPDIVERIEHLMAQNAAE